jgi:23S rRNA U2552 (ribose-2'-O)-methylase RlmE/FtsJ
MVSKYILVIKDLSFINEDLTLTGLLSKNRFLHGILNKYKNKITEHYKNKSWDKYKKLTNEYETIFTTPNTGFNISTYTPVSRSFFKMWEMIHDFKDVFNMVENMTFLFLAEGPGGFAEAFVKYRNNSNDKYYGISLKPVNKNIPEWKYQDKVIISYGEDNTGDLYNKNNIDYLVNNLPKLNIITADGGFDFSNDFNSQEESSLRLILCEIYAACLLQEQDGHFILKIYDIFHEYTLKTICFLKRFYKLIHMVKPLSSRPANSEKYLICTNFVGSNQDLLKLGNLIRDYDNLNLKEFFKNIPYDLNVLHNIVSYNLYYTLRQSYYIETTVQYINEFSKTFYDENIKNKIKEINTKHKEKAIKWCQKYNLPHVM